MIATKVYNWHGKLIGYNCDENYSWIPVEPTLHGYRELMQKITDGNCVLQEPQITNVQKAYNREAVFNGYMYCDMFIPLDNTNHLYNLIESRIKSGICIVTEPTRHVTASIKKFIVCVTFRTAWQSLKSTYEADLCYPINDNATSYNYHVRFFNMPISNTNELELLNQHYSINGDYSSFASEPRFYVAVLEVTIPIDRLKHIFRIQKKFNMLSDYILDVYNMHMQHTGRSQREGPDIGWLIQHFNDYSFDPIADIGNRAIDAISLEGWEEEPKYISRKYFSTNHIVYKCLADDKIELGYFQIFGYNNKILTGQAGENSEFQLANRTQTPQHSFITSITFNK